MKKLFLLTILLTFTSYTLTAQYYNKKIKGNGNLKTTTINVSDYDKISVAGNFEVNLYKGNEGDITIKTDENLMEYRIVEAKDGKLKIKTEKGYSLKPSKKIEIKVPFEDLNALSLAGSGNFYTEDVIKTEDLKLSLAGSGNYNLTIDSHDLKASVAGSGNTTLNGTTHEFACSLAGSGNINAYNLKAVDVKASVAGSGKAKLYASDELKASVAGSGNISYKGNPEKVKANAIGSGKIKSKS